MLDGNGYESAASSNVDIIVINSVNTWVVSLNSFRNSESLKSVLLSIFADLELHWKVFQEPSFRARLASIMQLLVAQLCIPRLMSFLGVGSIALPTGLFSLSTKLLWEEQCRQQHVSMFDYIKLCLVEVYCFVVNSELSNTSGGEIYVS
jgi:hypothetical protein